LGILKIRFNLNFSANWKGDFGIGVGKIDIGNYGHISLLFF